MFPPKLATRAPLLLSLLILSCNVLNTRNTEASGYTSFNPQRSLGTATSLTLQMFNGCATLPTGVPIAKGSVNIPYPSTCQSFAADVPAASSAPPTGTLNVLAGHSYYLGQLSVMDFAQNLHTNPYDLQTPAAWIQNAPSFQGLDWTGLSVIRDEWLPSENYPGFFERTVRYGNAAWMIWPDHAEDQTFDVEIMDSTGTVQGVKTTYSRQDFLGESPTSGHTQLSFEYDGAFAPPSTPSNLDIIPALGPPVTFRTYARLDMKFAFHPEHAIAIPPGLTGDAAIRITWSERPNQPYYFPIKLVNPSDLPALCYSGQDQVTRVPCGFGINPEIHLSPPANGGFYAPGETFDVLFGIRDDNGNFLHPANGLGSYNDMLADKTNGLLFSLGGAILNFREQDIITMFGVLGPIQNARPQWGLANSVGGGISTRAVFSNDVLFNTDDLASSFIPPPYSGPGDFDASTPTHRQYTLPATAKPGTWVAIFKISRYYLGERHTKEVPVLFQVGQAEPTNYPGRVGNCQQCHMGPVSLANIRHGLGVEHIEACKTCHQSDVGGRIHRLHALSSKFPLPLNDCRLCHLTRESTTRPSIAVCSSCHPQPHGTDYFSQGFVLPALGQVLSRESNCGQTCHVLNPPKNHILPAQ